MAVVIPWSVAFRDEPQRRLELGRIVVNDDGHVLVQVDDDYYDGEIAPDDVRRLAEALRRL